MTKKLLMNNYAENGMLPITDGLVCWLDGRDGQTNDVVWKDRSGNNNDFELTVNQNFENNGVCFNSSSLGKTINGLNLQDDLTFEIKYIIPKDAIANRGLFFLGKQVSASNSNSVFGYYTFTEIRNNVAGKCRFDINADTVYQNVFVCCSQNSKIYNDSVIVAESEDDRSLGNYLKLGGTRANPDGKVIIYYVRIYNRALTEEEIQHNYLYEQSIERGE